MSAKSVAFRRVLSWALSESLLTFEDVVAGGGYEDVQQFAEVYHFGPVTFMDLYHVASTLRISIDRLQDLMQDEVTTPLWEVA